MSLVACSSDDDSVEEEVIIDNDDPPNEEVIVDTNTDLFELTGFIQGNVKINVVEQTLSHGEVADVYEITASNSTSIPVEPVSYTHLTLPTILLV